MLSNWAMFHRLPPTNVMARHRRASEGGYDRRERRDSFQQTVKGIRSFRHDQVSA
jgi:hypothetical protein